MNIEEAIHVNTILQDVPILKDNPQVVAALQLDNEALKRVKEERLNGKADRYNILPGETP